MRQNEYNEFLSKIRCSDDFRKSMQEKLSAEPADTAEYEDSVSGTEVITAKHRWGRFAAMAAAFVLICGAVGGGVYHFANMPDNDENIEQDIEDDGTIYSHLKANIDKCGMDVTLCLYGSTIMGYPDCEPDKFFEYMDNFDMRNEVEEGDILETSESLKVVFADDDYTIAYIFEIYANGDCKWTEKHGEEERTTYHSFVDGEKVPKDILNMYIVISEMDEVTKEEMQEFLDSGFANRDDDKAYFYCEDQSSGIEYTVKNKTELKNELLKFEWERADGYSIGATDYWLLGFMLSNEGYMKRLDGKNSKIYKLKNRSDIEKFHEICDEYIVENTNENVPIYNKLIADKENYSADLRSDNLKKDNIDMEKLFEYLDNYNMSEEIKPEEYAPSSNRIKVFFRKNGEEKENHSYVGTTENYDYKLEIYDNGIFTWTINESGFEQITIHRFDDGDKVFNELSEMFAD